MSNIIPYIKLMRLNKPIGIWLFLWPTLWALWLAAEGMPSLKILSIFVAGVFVMRSAGCVINDICDQKYDGQVQRTKDRPLVKGEVTLKQTRSLFLILAVIAASLALQLNYLTLKIAFVVFLLSLVYPLTKRWFNFPQIVLGATVASAVPMAFASIQNQLPYHLWLIFVAALLMPLTYDTIYALVDRPDDVKIGVKSTAVWIGGSYQWFIGLLQICLIGLFVWIGLSFSLHWSYYVSIICIVPLFIRQQWLIQKGHSQAYFKAFLESHWVGFFILLGTIASYSELYVSKFVG